MDKNGCPIVEAAFITTKERVHCLSAFAAAEIHWMSKPSINLELAGAYKRTIAASLDRIWENVFDWEHLSHLHKSSFASCELIERSNAGWRVALAFRGGAATQIIELRADRANGRYVSTTLAGEGAGTEIRVMLTELARHITAVRVEFHLPESDSARLAKLAEAYRATYARLWDEDEAMMRHREAALAHRNRMVTADAALDLGTEAAVRNALPLSFELATVPFRVVELDGSLVAHATVCPHWLGPLADALVEQGAVRCPWHGYSFDVRSGRCLSGQALELAPAPTVTVVDGRVLAVTRVRS